MTILDVLSQVGGIFSITQSFCALIVGFWAQKMLFFSVFSKCYTFDLKNNGNKVDDKNYDNKVMGGGSKIQRVIYFFGYKLFLIEIALILPIKSKP